LKFYENKFTFNLKTQPFSTGVKLGFPLSMQAGCLQTKQWNYDLRVI